MENNTFRLLIIILVVSLLVVPVLLAEDIKSEDIIYHKTDPTGDDWGPGTYTYPKHKHFKPYHGLYDLTKFSIINGDSNYIFRFSFVEINDPWRSKYGFSHPLIQLYIDNESGGSTELLRPGAKVNLSDKAQWDYLLNVTGWWVRLFQPLDREKIESMSISWNEVKNPYDLEGAIVELDQENDLITVKVPKEKLGELDPAKFYLLVGGFYPFGQDHYREVKESSQDWAFGGSTNLQFDTRVVDILVPQGKTQEEILKVGADAETYPTIPYLSIGNKSRGDTTSDQVKSVPWIGTLIIIFLLGIIIKLKSKKESVTR